jgi:hypothetical protein
MKKKCLSVVHFHPLELYPPVTNLIHYLNQINESFELKVYTTKNLQNLPEYVNKKIKINRFAGISQSLPIQKRFWAYIAFNIGCLFHLLLTRPAKVLYYDTLSSFPVIIYYYLSFKRIKLFIHYHEYVSPREYKEGMWLLKTLYALEKKLLPRADWISQTNEDRINLFKNDYRAIPDSVMHILLNYPPSEWKKYIQKKDEIKFPLRLLYIGSISLETMYFKEVFSWISSLNGKLHLDIYSRNIPDSISEYLNNLGNPDIKLKGAIEYNLIPQLCLNYDVGLIVYKAHIPNVKFCASNKLFEYYACGLDVWVSQEMISSIPYMTAGTYPKVLMVDFKSIDTFDIQKAISRNGVNYKPSDYYYESVYSNIAEFISNAKR